jgi:hypothetical protein
MVLEIIIVVTATLILWCGVLLLVGAYDLSDEFLIVGNWGKKKSFFKRMKDGLRIMWSL